ncbi:MAG: shikimate dehydrogenase [Bacteroidota bacterium]
MKRYAIIGHPVSHALSPRLHTAAFKALSLDCSYEAVETAPEDLAATIQRFRDEGVAGFNVTVPHKEAIIPLIDSLDDAARGVGAVNTVTITAGKLAGTNTDVYGFIKLAEPLATAIAGKHVAVLGAGGAARAVLYALTSAFEPGRITLFNRTLDRAERLASEFTTEKILIAPESLFQEDLQKLFADISVIVNTTSVGMKPYTDATPLDEVKFGKVQAVIDLIYTPPETALLNAAREAGATGVNGLEMLLHQAAKAFSLWTGREMPMDVVRRAIDTGEGGYVTV